MRTRIQGYDAALSADRSIEPAVGVRFENPGMAAGASHAIGTNEVMEEEVAAFLGDILIARYPALLTARYGFALQGMDGPRLIEAVAKRRGCLIKGGGLDLEKASLILLDDYRSGTLGRISMETPQSREAMLARAPEAQGLGEKAGARD